MVKKRIFEGLYIFLCVFAACVLTSCDDSAGDPTTTRLLPSQSTKEYLTDNEIVPNATSTQSHTIASPTYDDFPCRLKEIYSEKNVNFVNWVTDDFLYKKNNDQSFQGYLFNDGRMTSYTSQLYEDYINDLVSSFQITDYNQFSVSPDNQKILFSRRGSEPTFTPEDSSSLSGEMPTNDLKEKIYLKNLDQDELFLGELSGSIQEIIWEPNSRYAVIAIYAETIRNEQYPILYLFNAYDQSLKVILYHSNYQFGIGVHNFSKDGQWIFISQGKNERWAQNIRTNQKIKIELPKNSLHWWGYNDMYILVEIDSNIKTSINYSTSKFYLYNIITKESISLSDDEFMINYYQDGLLSLSKRMSYIAIIDKDQILYVLSLCQ